MSYTANHTDDDCDKCGQRVGKKKLTAVPFLYLDKNDHIHPDMSQELRKQRRKDAEQAFGNDHLLIEMWLKRHPVEDGYRQYFICNHCKP